MGTRFERITESLDALAAVLASIPTTDAPWDTAFEQTFCANCSLENCVDCLHKNVDRIKWWLGQEKEPEMTIRSFRENPEEHILIRLYIGEEIPEGRELMNSIQAELIKRNRRRARHGGPVFSYRLELLR